MRILGCESQRREIVRTIVTVGKGHDSLRLPLWIAEGDRPGETMFLSAGLHGDEINGIAVVQQFVRELDLSVLRGRLVILPIVNVSGFHARTRQMPQDGKDLNRCFPGNTGGSLSEQLAQVIFSEVLSQVDWGVDVHDSGQGSVLLPHPRIHDDGLLEQAAAFGTDIIMRASLPAEYHGIMAIEARKRYRYPFLLVEVGGANILWPHLIKEGVVGLRNLLVYHDMLPGPLVLPRRQFILPGRDNLTQQTTIEGILTQRVALGKAVAKGQILSTIENPLTLEQAHLRAPDCGVVHDLSIRAKVNAGDDVVGVLGFAQCDPENARPRLETVETRINETSSQIQLRKPDIIDRVVELLA